MQKKIIAKMPENVKKIHKFICIFIIAAMIVGGFMLLLGATDSFSDLLMIGMIVLGAAVAILIDYILAIYFYGVALEKGYDDAIYLTLPLIFTLPGWLIVVALPARSATAQKTVRSIQAPSSTVEDLPEL